MSSPIPIRYPSPSDISPSSPRLYIPVHRRTPGSSRTPSPSSSPSSSPALSPPRSPASPHPTLSPSVPVPTPGVYTPAELLLLSTSPLARLSAEDVHALRALAPDVVQTRKRRKALAWHARHLPADSSSSHKTTSSRRSHAHTSEPEEDRATTWRRV